MDGIERYLRLSESVPGWTRQDEAEALARISLALPHNAVIVEIGSFLGSGTILMAGPRRLRGSGMVHCVDPFDASGDAFSVPQYRDILATADKNISMRGHFDRVIERAGLSTFVEVHQGMARDIAEGWTMPIDLLFLDGDHSRAGARLSYECWAPFLKPGGFIAVHNSHPGERAPDHDGYRRVAVEEIHPPDWTTVTLIGTTTFARKAAES